MTPHPQCHGQGLGSQEVKTFWHQEVHDIETYQRLSKLWSVISRAPPKVTNADFLRATFASSILQCFGRSLFLRDAYKYLVWVWVHRWWSPRFRSSVMHGIYSRTTYHSWLIYLDAFSKLIIRIKIVFERENAARWIDHLHRIRCKFWNPWPLELPYYKTSERDTQER